MTTNNAINNTLGTATFGKLISSINGAQITDVFGYPLLYLLAIGGTVTNYITFVNATTGNAPYIAATGSDANVALLLQGTGTYGVDIKGYTNGSNASAGYVGEVISSNIVLASAVTVSSAATANITSIILSAGDWDVWGNVFVQGTTVTTIQASISSVSATLPDGSLTSYIIPLATSTALGLPVPQITVETSGGTYYLVINPFGTGTIKCSGNIYARRRR